MASTQQITELKLKISEAETALHRIQLGDKEVRVSFGSGRQTQWNEVNINQLRRYINELKSELASLEGRKPRGPIYPIPVAR